MKQSTRALLLIGVIGCCTLGSHFFARYAQAVWGDRENWWTPRSLALPLDETRDDFRLFVGDELLQDRIRDGSVYLAGADGEPTPVAADAVKVRLNNWPTTKAGLLHGAVFSAFGFGVNAAFLGLGIGRWVMERRSSTAHPSHRDPDTQ